VVSHARLQPNRTVQIRAGQQTLTAAALIPDDLREAITKINSPDSAR
jgi:hypothetical protein